MSRRSSQAGSVRIVSASNRQINELNNQLAERDREITELRRENKLLQQIQRRQERALNRFEGDDSGMTLDFLSLSLSLSRL